MCVREVGGSNPRTRPAYQSDRIKDNTCFHMAGPSTPKQGD
jgi:hypothetical protein